MRLESLCRAVFQWIDTDYIFLLFNAFRFAKMLNCYINADKSVIVVQSHVVQYTMHKRLISLKLLSHALH